jgi:hypothetical protein
MNGLLITGFLAMLATPAASFGQSNFSGTWKVDFNSAMPKNINVWLLQNGTYKCTSCNPIVNVKADGKDQPVKGQPYGMISVKIVDPRTVGKSKKRTVKSSATKSLQFPLTGIRS